MRPGLEIDERPGWPLELWEDGDCDGNHQGRNGCGML